MGPTASVGKTRIGWLILGMSLVLTSPAWAPDQPATVGFEDATLWQATIGTLGMSATHVQGNASLSWTGSGFVEISSSLLATTTGIGATFSYQIRMPSVAPDPNFRG